MKKPYTVYDQDFKNYVVKLVIEEGKKMKIVSREMDIPYGTVRYWVGEYRKKQEKDMNGTEYITQSEFKKREKELLNQIKELEEEKEILKKAAHIFAKSQK